MTSIAMLSFVLAALSFQTPDVADRWRFHHEELEILEDWQRLSHEWRARPFALEHVSVVDVAAGALVADQTVRVRGDRIEWVGPAGAAQPADEGDDDEERIDASGKYLMPGLVDMHVHHLTSYSHPLLELACGVTTVRDMCGFPWLLEWRERIRAGELLAPDHFVAGHILNAMPMGMYATVVRTPDEARAAVEAQVMAGYDFIKTHNVLPLEVYRAICAEARLAGVPVVGHVPHDVTLAEAVAQGQSTLEHFKGYLLDATLERTSEDFVALSRAARPWLCPTLVTFRIGLRGEEAERFIRDAPGMRYVSRFERERWLAQARSAPADSYTRVHELSRGIFAELLATKPRFLAGTDSGGGYEHLIPGFALWDELQQMETLGLPTAEVLRAATLNPAEALGQRGRQGAVEVGQRAHLLLLDANPLEGVRNVQRVAGVAVRGLWLGRERLDEILAGIERVMAHGGNTTPPAAPDGPALDGFMARLRSLHDAGAVFMHHHLDEIGGLLSAAGRSEDAELVRAMKGAKKR